MVSQCKRWIGYNDQTKLFFVTSLGEKLWQMREDGGRVWLAKEDEMGEEWVVIDGADGDGSQWAG
jgi:hypothetical protein